MIRHDGDRLGPDGILDRVRDQLAERPVPFYFPIIEDAVGLGPGAGAGLPQAVERLRLAGGGAVAEVDRVGMAGDEVPRLGPG